MLTEVKAECIFCKKPVQPGRAIFIADTRVSQEACYNKETLRVGEVWGKTKRSLCHTECWERLEFNNVGY